MIQYPEEVNLQTGQMSAYFSNTGRHFDYRHGRVGEKLSYLHQFRSLRCLAVILNGSTTRSKKMYLNELFI